MKKFLGILLAVAMLMTSVVAMADTFEGVGTGMGGELKVAITVEDGKITAIEVVSHNETAGISDPAFAQIPDAIIANQSLAVDAVAGATMTSNALLTAVEAAAAAAGLDVEALKAAEVTYATELTADVVVVGAGGAGLAAATAATQSGASVIVIEKMGTVGGNSIICGGIYNSPDAELQEKVEMSDSVKSLVETALAEAPVSDEHAELQAAVKADFDAYVANGSVGLFDSANWYALQTWNGGDKVANLDLVKVLANNAFPGLEWLKSLGMQFSDVIGQGAGSLYQRTHGSLDSMGTGYIKVFMETVGAENVLTNTKGESLIMDETGRVVGVNATNPDGSALKINASKGVVIATGGFSANVEMREQYNTSGKWPVLGENIMTTNAAGITGDGIKMAAEVGANLVDMEQIQLLYLGNPFNGGMTRYTPRDLSGTDQII
ncbi:MAG: FAD-dependent oxidoreductase, partial [Clostridia bacterium]|nr:FAD-dependent oxidoreductase [Clostridia bacterium]